MVLPYYTRSIRGSLSQCLKSTSTKSIANSSRILCCNFNTATLVGSEKSTITSQHEQNYLSKLSSQCRYLSSTTNDTILQQRRHTILTLALQRVHDEGWTDDAIASGVIDAGLPPSYIGQATSSTSSFGSSDLVSFFMNECNASLKQQLMDEEKKKNTVSGSTNDVKSVDNISYRIHKALQMRLSMVLPFVSSNKWHEGMAIGALPQNAYNTAEQLDYMANIVLDYALEGNNVGKHSPTHRAAVIAAYAATELHLLSDEGSGSTISGNSISLSGDQYHATWEFLDARSKEVAELIVNGVNISSLNGLSLPTPTHVMAASAVASSLAGAALSMAAPSAAVVAGNVIPRAMSSLLTPLQNVVASQMNDSTSTKRDGTSPSDYTVTTDNLPPFDASEEIFSGSSSNGKTA